MDESLVEVLERARRLGTLGRRPIAEVVDHARRFVDALVEVEGVVVDLGSGGGIPGLVIAHDRPDLHLVLVDRRTSRTDELARAVRRLGWTDRVEVVASDVGELVRRSGLRADAAVARGFGPPTVTLDVAGRVVRPGGLIVISEPPQHDEDRWQDALAAVPEVDRVSGPAGVACFVRHR